jgi:hypothetical protein
VGLAQLITFGFTTRVAADQDVPSYRAAPPLPHAQHSVADGQVTERRDPVGTVVSTDHVLPSQWILAAPSPTAQQLVSLVQATPLKVSGVPAPPPAST